MVLGSGLDHIRYKEESIADILPAPQNKLNHSHQSLLRTSVNLDLQGRR